MENFLSSETATVIGRETLGKQLQEGGKNSTAANTGTSHTITKVRHDAVDRYAAWPHSFEPSINMQADYCHFENGAQESGSAFWTFKLEFGIVHTTNCSLCRSYMTHVAVANHSGDASFKNALNNREARVSAAFLDGLQSGRHMQEHDSPALSRYRDERDKALQDLDAAKKEMAVLKNKVLSLELAVQDPIKRGDEDAGSSIESSAKSDTSSVDRFLLSPSEDLDYGDALSIPLSTADNYDPPSIPNLPTAAEDKEAFHAQDPAKLLGSSLATIELLGDTVSTENDPQSSALLLKTSSSATPEPTKPSLRPSTTIKSWAQLAKASSSATPKPEGPSPQRSTCALGLSLDQQFLEPFGEANIATTNVRKLSWAQLARPSSSATPKPKKPSSQPSTCALNLSNPSSSQRSSSVQPLGETNFSTTNMHLAQVARPTSATPKPEKPSPRASTYALSLSNPSTSDQQSSSVESPGENITDVRKLSWAQLARPSSFATPKSEKPLPQLSTCALSPSNHSSSDQQPLSVLTTSPSPRPPPTIAHLEALMKAAHSGDDSSLTKIRAFCGAARRTPRKQRTELQQYALVHWRKPSPSVPSSVSSTETGTVHTTLGDGMFSTEIHVDSSAWGIGFVMDGLWLAWKFSDSLALSGNSIDNNWAEMLAVEVGLWTVIHWVYSVIQKEGDVIESLEIVVCSDNAGVVKAIEKRHSNFPPQQDILLRILDIVSEYNIQLSMRWISSTDNLADGPSRGVRGPTPDLLPFIPPLPSYLSDTLLLP